jgi:hypothetical protein
VHTYINVTAHKKQKQKRVFGMLKWYLRKKEVG